MDIMTSGFSLQNCTKTRKMKINARARNYQRTLCRNAIKSSLTSSALSKEPKRHLEQLTDHCKFTKR